MQNHGLRVNFRKIERPKCKICNTGPWVDFKETQGLLCKMAENFGSGFIFQRIKSWTGSTHPWTGRACSVHRGPMAAQVGWGQGAAARSPELGLRPLRCTKAHRRGRNRERSARGARLGPHRARAASWRPGDGGAEPEAAALGERKARAWREAKIGRERCGERRGWCSLFIGVGGAPGRGGRGG